MVRYLHVSEIPEKYSIEIFEVFDWVFTDKSEDDFYRNQNITIKLRSDLSPQKNAENFYRKSKNNFQKDEFVKSKFYFPLFLNYLDQSLLGSFSKLIRLCLQVRI